MDDPEDKVILCTCLFAHISFFDVNDKFLKLFKPSQNFCECFYRDVSFYWRVRSMFFMNILALSKKEDLLGNGLKVTLSLLKGAELTNFSMIAHWVVVLNPDRLC